MVAMLADNAKKLVELCNAVDRLDCPIADVEKEALVIALIRSVAEPMASGRGPSHAWCSGFAAADGSCRTCGAWPTAAVNRIAALEAERDAYARIIAERGA